MVFIMQMYSWECIHGETGCIIGSKTVPENARRITKSVESQETVDGTSHLIFSLKQLFVLFCFDFDFV